MVHGKNMTSLKIARELATFLNYLVHLSLASSVPPLGKRGEAGVFVSISLTPFLDTEYRPTNDQQAS
jgi:hypothetical protein